MTEKAAHSKIGASSMHRWSVCPGSVRMSEDLPNKTSEYAEEGTRAHELAAQVLTGGWPVGVDAETAAAIQEYTSLVQAEATGHELLVEKKFDLSEIYPGLYGTADAVVYDKKQKLLRVYDYKHGQGMLVEVKENPQLKYYALGALLSTGHQADEVELVIVQPRASHPDGAIRRWRFNASELLGFAENLYDYAEKTDDPNAALVAGDHCRFCPASGICPTLRERALAVAQTEFKPAFSYDPLVLSETLSKLEMLEGYAKSVREFAYSEAEHGRCPPGWKLVQKRATRKWAKSDEDTAAALECLFPEAILWEQKLKSPAQIEKSLSKEDKKTLGELVVSVSSGMTLAPESDSRAAALSNPKDEFKKVGDST